MAYCSKCGHKLDEDSAFCSECGKRHAPQAKPKASTLPDTYSDAEIQETPVVHHIHEKPKRSYAWVWILVIIIAAIILFNMVSSGTLESGSVRVNTERDDNLFSTKHTTTECGISGCKTTVKDCPFWDRDC